MYKLWHHHLITHFIYIATMVTIILLLIDSEHLNMYIAMKMNLGSEILLSRTKNNPFRNMQEVDMFGTD